MRRPLKILVQDYGWVHLGLGLLGNAAFFAGSILFLPRFEPVQTVGVWLFVAGSFLMLLGALGQFLVRVWGDD